MRATQHRLQMAGKVSLEEQECIECAVDIAVVRWHDSILEREAIPVDGFPAMQSDRIEGRRLWITEAGRVWLWLSMMTEIVLIVME